MGATPGIVCGVRLTMLLTTAIEVYSIKNINILLRHNLLYYLYLNKVTYIRKVVKPARQFGHAMQIFPCLPTLRTISF